MFWRFWRLNQDSFAKFVVSSKLFQNKIIIIILVKTYSLSLLTCWNCFTCVPLKRSMKKILIIRERHYIFSKLFAYSTVITLFLKTCFIFIEKCSWTYFKENVNDSLKTLFFLIYYFLENFVVMIFAFLCKRIEHLPLAKFEKQLNRFFGVEFGFFRELFFKLNSDSSFTEKHSSFPLQVH